MDVMQQMPLNLTESADCHSQEVKQNFMSFFVAHQFKCGVCNPVTMIFIQFNNNAELDEYS